MSTTRARMIETAAQLFQRDGYSATSWRGLVEQAGTPWGSVHHHFPGGKEELGVAAVDAGAEAVAALIRFCFQDTRDAPGAVERWFELSADLLVLSGYSAGCPIATVALETASSSRPIRDATRRAFRLWRAELARPLRREGLGPREARDSAETILALMEGGLLLARIEESRRPIRTAGRQAADVVRAALKAAGSTKPGEA